MYALTQWCGEAEYEPVSAMSPEPGNICTQKEQPSITLVYN